MMFPPLRRFASSLPSCGVGDPACGPAEPVPRRVLHSTLPAALLTIALLGGCSGRDMGNEWFPLRAGDEQLLLVSYQMDEPREPEEWIMRVRKPLVFQDQPVAVRHHSAGVSYYLKADELGVRRVATRTDIDDQPTAEEEPVWVLKAPYQVGSEWTSTTVPYLLQRKNEHPRDLKYSHRAQMTWRIESVDDTVTLAHGRQLKPCLRVVGLARLNLYTDPVNGFTDVPLIQREWFCKGEGLVKLEREERVAAGFMTGGMLSAELVR